MFRFKLKKLSFKLKKLIFSNSTAVKDRQAKESAVKCLSPEHKKMKREVSNCERMSRVHHQRCLHLSHSFNFPFSTLFLASNL